MVSKEFHSTKLADSRKERNKPRRLSEVLDEYFASDSSLAQVFRNGLFEGLYPHTEPCCQLKLLTHQRGRMPLGANLNGCIRRDGRDHYTFIETLPGGAVRRNPHVYEGEFITVTRRSDGSLRPNFKNLTTGRGFSVESYAFGVTCELREALSSLIEED